MMHLYIYIYARSIFITSSTLIMTDTHTPAGEYIDLRKIDVSKIPLATRAVTFTCFYI